MKRIYVIILIILTALFAVSGIMAAADWYREDRTTNVISVGNLSARLIDIYEQDTVAMPGDLINKVVSVKNTGMSDSLIRVRLSGIWEDNGQETTRSELSYEINEDDWLIDGETGYYYYTKVLPPDASTEPILKSFSLNGPNVNNYYSGRPGSITVMMEAVQAAAGGASVWGKTNEDLRIEYEERPGISDDSDSDVHFRGSLEGFHFGDESDLFLSFKNLLPGQTVIQNISVMSFHSQRTDIYLKADHVSPDSEELLHRLLTDYTDVRVNVGEKQVYAGPLWRVNSQGDEVTMTLIQDDLEALYGNGILVGSFETSGNTPITVEFELSREVGNEFRDLVGEVDWIFYARGSHFEPVPQTGDEGLNMWIILMIGSAALCLLMMAGRTMIKRRGAKRAMPLIIALFIIGVLGTTGVTMAFMTDAASVSNSITPGKLLVELEEPGFDPDTELKPGAAVVKDPFVVNKGTVPVLAYLEVKVPVATVRTVDADTKMIIPEGETQLFSFEVNDGWILLDQERVTGPGGALYNRYFYGYTGGVLAPGESTGALFNQVFFANILEGELAAGETLEMPLRAIGIQDKHIAEDYSMEYRLRYGYENLI